MPAISLESTDHNGVDSIASIHAHFTLAALHSIIIDFHLSVLTAKFTSTSLFLFIFDNVSLNLIPFNAFNTIKSNI